MQYLVRCNDGFHHQSAEKVISAIADETRSTPFLYPETLERLGGCLGYKSQRLKAVSLRAFPSTVMGLFAYTWGLDRDRGKRYRLSWKEEVMECPYVLVGALSGSNGHGYLVGMIRVKVMLIC